MSKVNQRHGRDSQEAMMTKDEALAWAKKVYENTGRWPMRRYRVEGGMRSRLLMKARAKTQAARYGGDVVEVVPPLKDPSLKEYRAAMKAQAAA